MPVEFIDRFEEEVLTTNDFELIARTNEGFIIRNLEVESAVADTKARIIIQDTTMLSIPCVAAAIGLIPIVNRTTAMRYLFEQLRAKYPDVPLLKVSEGENLVISLGGVAGTVRISYTQVTGELIPKPTDPGGSLSRDKLFISHSKKTLTITEEDTDIEELDTPDNPAGMFSFPFGIEAPANYEFELLAIAFGVANKHADITIDGFRVWHGDKTIFSRDGGFIPIESFPYMPNDKDNKLWLTTEKEVVFAGDELKTEIQASNVNVAEQTVDVYCTMIFLQKRV